LSVLWQAVKAVEVERAEGETVSGGNGKRPVYKVYRLGDASDLAPALERALTAHRERYGDPVGVAVSPRRLDVAQEALDGRGLEVIGCGGCLWWEVWLQVGQPAPVGALQEERTQDAPKGGGLSIPLGEDEKTVSLVARAAAARRQGGEMTPERARAILAQVEQLTLFEEVLK